MTTFLKIQNYLKENRKDFPEKFYVRMIMMVNSNDDLIKLQEYLDEYKETIPNGLYLTLCNMFRDKYKQKNSMFSSVSNSLAFDLGLAFENLEYRGRRYYETLTLQEKYTYIVNYSQLRGQDRTVVLKRLRELIDMSNI